MSARIFLTGCLIATAMIFQPVAAQTVYKSTMPDGRVIFGDRPEPGAAKVESSHPDVSKKGVQLAPGGAARTVDEMASARKREEANEDRLSAGEEAVRKAEAAVANGKEPLPGERTGTAGGGSRLNDSYWARQKKLREDLIKARDNLTKLRTEQGQ